MQNRSGLSVTKQGTHNTQRDHDSKDDEGDFSNCSGSSGYPEFGSELKDFFTVCVLFSVGSISIR